MRKRKSAEWPAEMKYLNFRSGNSPKPGNSDRRPHGFFYPLSLPEHQHAHEGLDGLGALWQRDVQNLF